MKKGFNDSGILPLHRAGGQHMDPGWRAFIGLCVSSRRLRMDGVVLRTLGVGTDARIELLATESLDLGDLGTPERNDDPATGGNAGAEQAAELVRGLVAHASVQLEDILCIGLVSSTTLDRALSSSVLAERTTLNVVDGFEERDRSVGGNGRCLFALPYWILLRDRERPRVVLELARAMRLTYLPPLRGQPHRDLVSLQLPIGTDLLDQLTRKLTRGEQDFDPGGRLAVQGRQLPDLLRHWEGIVMVDASDMRAHPRGDATAAFLKEALTMSVQRTWAVQDILCTANHFLAEAAAGAIRNYFPPLTHGTQLIVDGMGARNGFLIHEVRSRLPHLSFGRSLDWGFPERSLQAAAAALLAQLHVDHVPANLPAVTGARAPRVLGRLTPGASGRWQALLEQMAQSCPRVLPLRQAV